MASELGLAVDGGSLALTDAIHRRLVALRQADKPVVVLLDEAQALPDETLEALRRLAVLLDTRFVIPGTSIRFGLDPLFSLIPGIGDLVSPAFAMLLLVQSYNFV